MTVFASVSVSVFQFVFKSAVDFVTQVPNIALIHHSLPLSLSLSDSAPLMRSS